MAPISEKRPTIIKENTKENMLTTKTTTNSRSGGIEILDFRDSWLQEIEMYKDQVRAQQLLTAHNHLHTLDGYHKEFREGTAKRRARTKSDSDTIDVKSRHDDELVLKRAREDILSNSITHHKNRIDTSGIDPTGINNSTITTATTNLSHKQMISSSGGGGGGGNSSMQNSILRSHKSSGQKEATPKIIVNPYHASLLISHEMDKHNNKPYLNSIQSQKSNNNHHHQIINGYTYNSHTKHTKKSIQTQTATKEQHTNTQTTSSSNNNTTVPTPITTTTAAAANTTTAAAAAATATIATTSTTATPAQFTTKTNITNNGNGQAIISTNKIVETYAVNDVEHIIDDTLNVPKISLDHILSPIDNKSDDDDFNIYDDFDFGDIDNTDLYESSDESDDEYRGCAYAMDSDNITDAQSFNASEYFTPSSPFTPSLFPMVPPYLTFSSHAEKGPPLAPELQKILKWRLSPVMPKIVRRVVANSGFRLIKKTNDWVASWEKHMKSPCFKSIRSHQKFNHLPGTFKIGRKDSVWRNIKSFIAKHGKKEFGFMQKTFILPQDLSVLKKAWPKYAKKGTKWIIKPPASARGTGIKVVSRWAEFPKQKPLIVQKYIERPLLINGSKFDLRLYVIVTSINPLRIFMHTDGLARFASVQYSHNLETLNDRCMHLTNYSINKFSLNYTKNEDINACQGHKWTLKSLWSYFNERSIDTIALWGTLRNLVIKTIIGGESCLNRMYKTNVGSRYNCYELFGFDVLLDENLIPWLLEVNISPSLHSDLPLDLHVKGPLIQAVLNSALYQVPPKLSEKQEQNLLNRYNLKGSLCYDRRLFTTCLTQEEIKKHNTFTNRNIECREEYLDKILDDLTPDDLRCLIISEDELARSAPLERIFPTSQSHIFLNFLEGPRYYNRVLDAWESRYSRNRKEGILSLHKYCEKGIHLEVPAAAMDKEPTGEVDIFELNTAIKNETKQKNLMTIAENLEKEKIAEMLLINHKTDNGSSNLDSGSRKADEIIVNQLAPENL